MERAIVSRRDRLALAVRRQRQQPRQEFNNNGSIQPANNNTSTRNTTNGIDRTTQRRKRQRNQQTQHGNSSNSSQTLESKGFHPIVEECERIANNNINPTYMDIKAKLVRRWGKETFQKNKVLIVAVLAKLVPEHTEYGDIVRISKHMHTNLNSSKLGTQQRRLSLTQLNRNLLSIHDRLRQVFRPRSNLVDSERIGKIWETLSDIAVPCSLTNPHWVVLGCPGGDPAEELGVAGQLAVDCLLSTIRRERNAFAQMMIDFRSGSSSLYPFVRATTCITLRLCDIFGLCCFKGFDDITLSSRDSVSVLQVPRAKALSESASFENWFVLSLKRFHRKMCLSNNVGWEVVHEKIMSQVEAEIDAFIEIEEVRMRERSLSKDVIKSRKNSSAMENTKLIKKSTSIISTTTAATTATTESTTNIASRRSTIEAEVNHDVQQVNQKNTLFHRIRSNVETMLKMNEKNIAKDNSKGEDVDIVWSNNVFSSTDLPSSEFSSFASSSKHSLTLSSLSLSSESVENPMMSHHSRSSTRSSLLSKRVSFHNSQLANNSTTSPPHSMRSRRSLHPPSSSSFTSDSGSPQLASLHLNHITSAHLSTTPYSSPRASPRHVGRRRVSRMSTSSLSSPRRVSRRNGGGKGRNSIRSSLSSNSSNFMDRLSPVPPPPTSPPPLALVRKTRSLVNLLRDTWEDDEYM
jgi:hypothetical protein